MKKFLLGMLAGLVFAVMAGVVLAAAAMRLATRQPSLPESGILVWDCEGELPEIPPPALPLGRYAEKTPLSMVDGWMALEQAARDPRVRGLLLRPRRLSAGWGKLDELRAGIAALRKAGKPVYAWLQAPGTREYYLAAAAEKIYLSPEDWLDVKGLRIEAAYLRGTLDKLGVEMEVEHAGRYKDAADAFTRTGMSPETREVLNSILDTLFGRLAAGIADGRAKTPAEVRALLDQGPFLAPAAKRLGLVDDLIYSDEVTDRLRKQAGGESLARIDFREYARHPEAGVSARGRRAKRVAVVVAQGDILRADLDGLFGEERIITPAAMRSLLGAIKDDPGIAGVILRIDSPGGDATASDEILRDVRALSKAKPVVISFSDVAASGGYYIAMSGDPIVAYPGTLTGSIGVIYGKVNLRGLYDKIGISKEILKRGRFADIDSDYQPLTPAGREKLRESIGAVYDSFLERVGEGRKLERKAVQAVAQGRVWTGEQARERKLVDELGGLTVALDRLKERLGVEPGERVSLVSYPRPKTWFEVLFGPPRPLSMLEQQAPPLARLGAGIAPWLQGGLLRVAPYRIEVR